jgi:hypothetical protein
MSNNLSSNVSDSDNNSRNLLSFFKNPYKQIKQITITRPINNEQILPLSSSCGIGIDKWDRIDSQADDFLPWGDNLQQKQNKDTRILFQNINGLSTKNLSKWKTSLEWLKKNDTDIVGLAEPCINVQNPRTLSKYLSAISTFGDRAIGHFAHNTNPSESSYQPGGSFILCTQAWKSRIVQKIQDSREWGRFVGYTYRL